MKHYEHSLFENGEMRLDIKSMIPQQYEWIKEYLPNHAPNILEFIIL